MKENMEYPDRAILSSVALISFLATILAAIRGNFTYPLELFLLALLGVLLVVSLMMRNGGAASSPLYVVYAVFFAASIANMAYLYSVVWYLSPARTIALGIAILGLLLSVISLMRQPVPAKLKAEVKKLIAAEKKLTEAKQKLEKVKTAMPRRARKRTASGSEK